VGAGEKGLYISYTRVVSVCACATRLVPTLDQLLNKTVEILPGSVIVFIGNPEAVFSAQTK
jgi:hypothetical protein